MDVKEYVFENNIFYPKINEINVLWNIAIIFIYCILLYNITFFQKIIIPIISS